MFYIFAFIIGLQIVFAAIHPDAGLDIHQLATKYGYKIEDHIVQTEDGYLLTMHRINSNNTDKYKLPVFLMHGVLSSSTDWVNSGPERALSLLLANEGYDVWLGNQRGNTWCQAHVELDPIMDASEFYDFSFEDIGLYDLPAKIDYILNTTGHNQIYYVGHSQGTTTFFVMLALKPEYNDKIKFMTALAPVAFEGHIKSPLIKVMAPDSALWDAAFKALNISVVLPHYDIFTEIGETSCADGSEYQDICYDFIFLLGGIDREQLNSTFLSVIFSNAPAGASVKQLIHYLQLVDSYTFQRYDYGSLNLFYYGQTEPPEFNLSNIIVPMAFHYCEKDILTSPEDIEILSAKVNVIEKRLVPYENFSHIDFLWATDVVELVYNNVIEGIKNN